MVALITSKIIHHCKIRRLREASLERRADSVVPQNLTDWKVRWKCSVAKGGNCERLLPTYNAINQDSKVLGIQLSAMEEVRMRVLRASLMRVQNTKEAGFHEQH